MKRTNKKGFTIVELVIVIAVIAILAAVLIPTYSSLVKKANISADEQAVRQMNTALAIYTAENGAPKTLTEVKKALDENLINTESISPVTQEYAFYWNPTDNKIVLVGADKETAKEGWLLLSSTGYGNVTEADSTTALQGVINASSNMEPALIKLTEDVTLSTALKIESGKTVIIDLQNHKLSLDSGNDLFEVETGTLTLKNGTVNAQGRCVWNNGGDVTLQGVTLSNTGNDSGYYPVVKIDGISNTAIVDCKLNSAEYVGIATNSSAAESDGARLSIIESEISGKYVGIMITIYADITIENSSFSGAEHGAFFRGCNAHISNSTFTHTQNESAGKWVANGNKGPAAGICFASGGNTASGFGSYTATANYVCENVTADKVVLHEPEGGNVTVTGIDSIAHTCHGNTSISCSENSTCGE